MGDVTRMDEAVVIEVADVPGNSSVIMHIGDMLVYSERSALWACGLLLMVDMKLIFSNVKKDHIRWQSEIRWQPNSALLCVEKQALNIDDGEKGTTGYTVDFK